MSGGTRATLPPGRPRSLSDSLGALEEDGLPGLRNEGFLASHELTPGVPTRSGWIQAKDKAHGILGTPAKTC